MKGDKSFWRPLGALLARVGFPLAQFPFRAPGDFRPTFDFASSERLVGANDDTFHPSPETA